MFQGQTGLSARLHSDFWLRVVGTNTFTSSHSLKLPEMSAKRYTWEYIHNINNQGRRNVLSSQGILTNSGIQKADVDVVTRKFE